MLFMSFKCILKEFSHDDDDNDDDDDDDELFLRYG